MCVCFYISNQMHVTDECRFSHSFDVSSVFLHVLFLTTSFVCQLVSLFFFNKFLSCFIPRTFFSVDSVASKIKVARKINFWLKTKNTSIKKLISSVLSSKVFFLKFIFVLNMRIFECEGVRM